MKPPRKLIGEALKEWKRVSVLLEAQGLLTPLDSETLCQYCETKEQYLTLRKLVQQQGYSLTAGKNGVPYPNPNVGSMNKALELMLKLARRFGLDPESRRRLAIADNANEDGSEIMDIIKDE